MEYNKYSYCRYPSSETNELTIKEGGKMGLINWWNCTDWVFQYIYYSIWIQFYFMAKAQYIENTNYYCPL